MSKKVLITWSGGLDSTYLVYKNLKEGNMVIPVYLSIENNGSKVESEKKSIEKMYEVFKEMKLDGHLEPLRDDFTMGVNNASNLKFAQIPIWICGILYSSWDHIDEIQMGYVMNDDAVSYVGDIKKIFRSYKDIIHDEYSKIKLTFPLLKMGKKQIWNEMPDVLRQKTVFCECPYEDKDCGECETCKRYEYEGLFLKYERNSLNEDVSELVLEEMVKEEEVVEYEES